MKAIPKTPADRRTYQARLWARPQGAALDAVACVAALAREPWEEDPDHDQQVRRVWLGTVFGLTPSGKIYAPFACSNVAGCKTCGGRGTLDNFKRRVVKKRHAKQQRMRPIMYGGRRKLFVFTHRERRDAHHAQWLRTFHNYAISTRTCTACGGTGSREAHLDELWREHHEKLFEDYGLHFEYGENGDYFATEYRDKPEEDDDDNADDARHPEA